jgi:hypothetical protein
MLIGVGVATGGDQGEMDCLSEQTQLKLSKRFV